MQKSTNAAVDEAAAILRAVLIRIFSGKRDKSRELCGPQLDIPQIHA